MSLSIAERHQLILNELKKTGHVSVSDLSKRLRVSSVTIRKDLKLLESRKLLFRTHGSATPQDPYISDRPVNEKEKLNVEEKQAIARKAIELLQETDSIILGSGTTIHEFAKQIPPYEGLTIISTSLIASQQLMALKNIEVIQIGGLVRKTSSSLVGPIAENMLKSYSCNKLFLGVDGIEPDFGITTTNAMEASLNQTMIESAHKVIVLADSSKFGRKGFGKICGLERIDTIITDHGASESIVNKCRDKGVEVILV